MIKYEQHVILYKGIHHIFAIILNKLSLMCLTVCLFVAGLGSGCVQFRNLYRMDKWW